MDKNAEPFLLKQPIYDGISLVITAVCTKCNKVVEMAVKKPKGKTTRTAFQGVELQCPQCKTIYRVPAITKHRGKRRNEVNL